MKLMKRFWKHEYKKLNTRIETLRRSEIWEYWTRLGHLIISAFFYTGCWTAFSYQLPSAPPSEVLHHLLFLSASAPACRVRRPTSAIFWHLVFSNSIGLRVSARSAVPSWWTCHGSFVLICTLTRRSFLPTDCIRWACTWDCLAPVKMEQETNDWGWRGELVHPSLGLEHWSCALMVGDHSAKKNKKRKETISSVIFN